MRPTNFEIAFHGYANKKRVDDDKIYSILSSLNSLIQGISSPKADIRNSALRHLNDILLKNYLGEKINGHIDPLVASLRDIYINDKSSKSEIDLSLNIFCILSLHSFNEFRESALILKRDLMPTGNHPCPFPLAFVSCFSLSDEEIVDNLIQSINNLKTVNQDLIRSITILVSFAPENFVYEISENIFQIIQNNLTKNVRAPIVTAILDLFLCTFDALQNCHMRKSSIEEQNSDAIDNDRNVAIDFANKCRQFIENVEKSIQKKADQKTIRSQSAETLRIVDGTSEKTFDFAFGVQHVTIKGSRKVFVLNTIKKIAQKNFLNHLAENIYLQEMLGFTLLKQEDAVKMEKRFKSEISSKHMMTKKERELAISKQRKQKEERETADDF
ncbi:hypothetical protein TRFO_22018 [Tritrichomonas foetus]|uniref:Interferon-related developmental regulator N-terminal domain-containing protein n=1 Tax=Tritrichomonas foetus TaxID=1144522 RepID=A0A1J4KHR3_9EUKA|nr:hypothetical protein TRFO_22018 [Tritrichomonas foetus]|eukprot:OHT09190.1 hypothetical protein TRFO_22018 [Tritrichomonas foetus]